MVKSATFVFILLPFVFSFLFFFDFAASGVREYSSRLRLLLHRAFKCGSGWPFLPLPSSQNRPGPCRPLITVRSNSE